MFAERLRLFFWSHPGKLLSVWKEVAKILAVGRKGNDQVGMKTPQAHLHDPRLSLPLQML